MAQAGQANGTDKIYSDAEMEAELAPLKEKIAALETENQSLKDATSIAINDAVAAKETEMKASFVADMTAAEADNMALIEKYKA